ncbi:glycoside hydrolase family 19 protein [Riemerella anatipestifer]
MINQAQKIIKEKYKLSNEQMAHFLGQLAHESGSFRSSIENLNYSADSLLRVFKKYFTPAQARAYARQPEKIANRVYANRMGNGNETSGDGWKYRGRGYIQLTGKNNYKAFSQFIGEDCVSNPDLVATKYPYESAIWFFRQNKILSIATKIDVETIKRVTRLVNGGYNGLDDRIRKTRYYYSLLK